MMHSTGKPTRREQTRIEQMLKLGCAACAMIGIANGYCEVHHILSGNRRMGHWYTIPLCPGHHRGVWDAGLSDLLDEEARLGCVLNLKVSVSSGRKAFEATYGTERAMWERIQKRLKLSLAWPVSKVLPRSYENG